MRIFVVHIFSALNDDWKIYLKHLHTSVALCYGHTHFVTLCHAYPESLTLRTCLADWQHFFTASVKFYEWVVLYLWFCRWALASQWLKKNTMPNLTKYAIAIGLNWYNLAFSESRIAGNRQCSTCDENERYLITTLANEIGNAARLIWTYYYTTGGGVAHEVIYKIGHTSVGCCLANGSDAGDHPNPGASGPICHMHRLTIDITINNDYFERFFWFWRS